MSNERLKYNIPVITSEVFNLDPNRYELRKGNSEGAPLCPFGNHFKWIGYDLKSERYVRVTKSVFKRLIILLDGEEVALHDAVYKYT